MSASTTADPRVGGGRRLPALSGRQALTILGPFIGLALVILLFSIPPQIRGTCGA